VQLENQMNQIDHSVFNDYIKILRQQKWLIVFCLLLIVIPVTIFTYTTPPVYEAGATIIFDEPHDTMFALDLGQSSYNKSALVNLTEQIKSRTLARKVTETLPGEVLKTFKFPEPVPENFSKIDFISQVLQKNIFVSSIRGGDILKITLQASHPKSAAIIANTYLDRLIEWNLNKKREEISNIRSFVENQLIQFKDKLKLAEEALQTFQEKNNLVSLSASSTEILNRSTAAEVAYNQAKAEREALEQRLYYIRQKTRELEPTLKLSSKNHNAEQLRQQLFGLERRYSSIQVQSTEAQDELTSLRQQITDIKQKLIQELLETAQQENLINPLSRIQNMVQESITLEVDLETYKVRERELKKILDDYNVILETLPQKELELARFIREKEVNDNIYSILLEKLEEARINEAGKTGDIEIIDKAIPPNYPIKPKKKVNIALGFILGLAVGIGLAFFLDYLNTSIKSQEDIEKYLKLTVLASIPTIETNGVMNIVKKRTHTKKSYNNKLLFEHDKKSTLYEAFRALQINFGFVNADNNLQNILVTSPTAGDGKTLTSINMALSFITSGKKTLLLDCDMRRPMIHRILNLNKEPGLSEVLINKVKLEDAVQKYADSGLNVISCGILPPNPSELFDTQRMRDLLNDLKNKYDILVLDAPPLIAVTDSLILSNEVDGVCLVIKSGKTRFDAALKARKLLENSKAKIIGSIINDVNFKNVYTYYKDYYYYSQKKSKREK